MIREFLNIIFHGVHLKDIIGFLLIITGIFDAWKYMWESKKIKSVRTAKGHSRKFINMAILNNIVRITYSIVIIDFYLIFINIVALTCMLNLWITIYKLYPYRNRGLVNFKRPNIIIYLINSILPNKLRKRL